MLLAERTRALAELCDLLDGRGDPLLHTGNETQFALARRHRVEPLVHVRLGNVADALASDYRANVQRVLRSFAWLSRLLRAFADAGIEARPLKGLALASKVYERVADRHCGDLDLLIEDSRQRDRADRVARALDLRPLPPFEMSNAGLRLYRQLYKEDGYVSTDGLHIELHYLRGGMGQHMFPPWIGFVSSSWEPWRIDQIDTHRLRGDSLALYLLSHGTRARWQRLKWLLDLRRLTVGFDDHSWDDLRFAARMLGVARQAEIGLHVLGWAFGDRTLARPHARSFAVHHCVSELGLPDTAPISRAQSMRRMLYAVMVQRGWRGKLAVATRNGLRLADVARWSVPPWLLLPIALLVRPFSLAYRRALRPAARRLSRPGA